jgi:hypothetical protein
MPRNQSRAKGPWEPEGDGRVCAESATNWLSSAQMEGVPSAWSTAHGAHGGNWRACPLAGLAGRRAGCAGLAFAMATSEMIACP